eukprot:TRINITY_DN19283_c0_g2_i1.p1 TRINITY_DN19283_c0_g2~~TRINITY_DN19283_c0_g2_i1.p1  ORF type:complete len:453 (+),score=19.17 TRINITY_DN19283_c0_g2_i1:124-1359(+)
MNNKGRTKDGRKPVDVIQAEYWGAQPQSWQVWFWQDGLIRAWQAEDEFFPSSFALAGQKIYLMIELFVPWLLLTFMWWKFESVWYLLLVVFSALFATIVVDNVFKRRHELVLQAKMLVIIPFIPAYLYLQSALELGVGDLIWSFTFYFLCGWMLLEFVQGIQAFWSRVRIYGFWHQTSQIINTDALGVEEEDDEEEGEGDEENDWEAGRRNRTASGLRNRELILVHEEEARKVQLFAARLRIPKMLSVLRGLQPVLTLIPLGALSFLAAQFSDTLTTIQFSSRVTEAWKKAYVRPSPTQINEDEEKRNRQAAAGGTMIRQRKESHTGHSRGHPSRGGGGDPFVRQRAFSPGYTKHSWASSAGGGAAGFGAGPSSSLSPLQSATIHHSASVGPRRGAKSRGAGPNPSGAFFN